MREKSSQFEGKIRSARKRVEAKPICLSCNKPFASRETVERLLGRGRMSPSTAKRSWKFTSPRATLGRGRGEQGGIASLPSPPLLAVPSPPRRALPCVPSSPRLPLLAAFSPPRCALPSTSRPPLLAVLSPPCRALPSSPCSPPSLRPSAAGGRDGFWWALKRPDSGGPLGESAARRGKRSEDGRARRGWEGTARNANPWFALVMPF